MPTLLEAMEDSDPGRTRSAIRIAGESQNPGAVPRLAEILIGEDEALREITQVAEATGLPTDDPVRFGASRLMADVRHALEAPSS